MQTSIFESVLDGPPFVIYPAFIIVLLGIRYAWAIYNYRQMRKDNTRKRQIPPSYPALFPYLGNTLAFAWNTGSFLANATSYKGSLTATRISLLGFKLYVFQDRETICKIMRHPYLSSPMSLYVFGERFLFGMPQRGISEYIADDSGPSVKPFPGSNVPCEKRVDYMLHKAFNQAWTGHSLTLASRRFVDTLVSHIDDLNISGEYIYVNDLFKFFGRAVSASVTQTIFGASLLQLNPDIIDNAWTLDEALPWMFRQVPSFIMPRPYKVRKILSNQIRMWYSYARQWFTESSIFPDGDGDPFWGSKIIRHLQQELLKNGDRGFIDDECFAAHDMGLIWGSNSNVISATMLVAFHIFQDPTLLRRVRSELEDNFGQSFSIQNINHKDLWKLPLLSSVYAEVLRLYVDVLLIFPG
ncbi:cytochrome P450 [Daldinia vernicosa]|uniref:cytochrome P450 n=1 Tax=Daldinia vernicosa TaxID=114800 RepID=UPI002007DAD7|nr:cytochrome P450 [Daldinia vernicosa]KAI0843808.1 cytochrome P450 [Daldinia vernicosa]